MDTQPFIAIPPRVIVDESGSSAPLVDELESLISRQQPQVIGLTGVGKTTALRFVAEYFAGHPQIAVMDDEFISGSPSSPLIVTSNRGRHTSRVYTLATWGRDEFIDYLLRNHASRCGAVIGRLKPRDMCFTNGAPEVWQRLLDDLAADSAPACDFLATASQLFERSLQRNDPELTAEQLSELLMETGPERCLQVAIERGLSRPSTRLLTHADMRDAFLAPRLIERLLQRDKSCLKHWLNADLLQIMAAAIRSRADVMNWLNRSIQPDWPSGVAAGLLLRANPDWMPASITGLDFSQASLPQAQWAGCKLTALKAVGANLSSANLAGSDFSESSFSLANLSRANLQHAVLNRCSARRILLTGADLQHASAVRCSMGMATLRGADLRHANFATCVFSRADLSSADLAHGTFDHGQFSGADLRDTNLSGASVRHANLSGVDLRQTRLAATNFSNSQLQNTNLEDVDLRDCCFESANLVGGLLTGSHAYQASFQSADLRNTGLAEIEWYDCDLRGADLHGAAFHMGSTRCGLVGSPYPSHGTRTGFYTDEHEDLYYKQPELIRKACLVGCDLRGAHISDVDFYLVDLRRAKIDRQQRKHVRDCGAILE